MRVNAVLFLLVLVIAAGCQQRETEVTTTTSSPQTATTQERSSEPMNLSEGFQTPESVLYDAEQDVYFISNINGGPFEADDNGYISRVNAESLQVESKWIDGGKTEITLNAPKGLAIVGDELYVTDITLIRKFDRRSGQPKGEISVRGTTFLNDLATDGSSTYASDSGLKLNNGEFAPSGSDAIYKIAGNNAQKVASGSDLNRPNGLALVDGKTWAVSFGSNELYAIDGGKKTTIVKLPKGSLDGLLVLPDGSFLVTSWDAKAVYRGRPDGTFELAIENLDSPADLGYDTKRHRLLVPHFMESRVSIHSIQ
jgi:sugar lactone lactonase YvrE